MWYYTVNDKTVFIIPNNGRYIIKFDNEFCGSYHSPEAAADDVSNFIIGNYEWDKLDGTVSVPSDLSEWTFSNR